MTERKINDRIEKYIDAIKPIPEGQRDTSMYNLALCLKSNFGLTDAKLETVLSEVNQTKCTPPLADADIQKIARSANQSNVPVGDGGGTYTPPNRRRATTPPTKKYVVNAAETPVAVSEILKKEVSIYTGCLCNTPSGTSNIGLILHTIRTGGRSKDAILAIRNEPDKKKRNELKKDMTAVVFGSEPQNVRKDEHCNHNGVYCFDFDDIDDIEKAKTDIAALPYVFAVGVSVSGNGIFALVHYEGTPVIKTLLGAIQKDITYKIDTSRSDLCGLRFVSLDENLILKDKVCPAVLTERIMAAPENKSAITPTGVDVLDRILAKFEPVDWNQYCTAGRNDEIKPPSERDYILRTCERILATASETPIVNKQESIYCYTGTHYRIIADSELRNFLIEAALRCGVPNDTAIYQFFVEKLTRQFYINAGRVNTAAEPDTAFINLINGTLFFGKTGHQFEKHTPDRFIRYVLDFDYNPDATAPLWQKHLDRSLPHTDKQKYLAECLALPFYRGKIEKAPIFFGQRDTGKSTTLDVYKRLIGDENMSTESLEALTRTDNNGGFSRARLDGKLINIASDVSAKISDDGMAKTLISREEVSAAFKYKNAFNMRNYARLIFAMNILPPQFFTDAALTKRAAIIEFDRQVTSKEKDVNFAERIIANELPGVLNWIIDGLIRLTAAERLDPPPCCAEAMERIRKESDPLYGWLEERQYHVGNSTHVALKDAYDDFKEYCRENGNKEPSRKSLASRLRNAGYKLDRPNHETGLFFYYSNCLPKNDADCADGAAPLENKGEMPGTIPAQSRHEKNDAGMMPPGNTVNIGVRHNRHERHEKTENNFDGECASELPPPGCQKCVYHVPTTYPDGLCAEGYCQQNLPCHDFTEIANPENIAG